MDKQRIAITGIGIVAPNGIGKDEFWSNCLAGTSGIKPITLFDTSKYRCSKAGEVSNFHPETVLGPRGLRNLDRTTLLSLAAAKLAIEDSGIELVQENADSFGIVLGSTLGSVYSISEFDKIGLKDGPRYVNPAHFPNTVINSPASQIAIRLQLRGLNATISTGFTASLDALGYAFDMLRLGRVRRLLVGGVEELCLQTFLGFYKIGFLKKETDLKSDGSNKAFKSGKPGVFLGEGAAILLLESLEDATDREATVYAELLGYGSQFNAASINRYDPEARGAKSAIKLALSDAGLEPNAIGIVSSSANTDRSGDLMELEAFKSVFSGCKDSIYINAVKELIGEAFSASGALQLAANLGSLFKGKNLISTALSEICNGSYNHSSAEGNVKGSNLLITSFGPSGTSSALILGRSEKR